MQCVRPLHLKNNCVKELFMRIKDIVVSQAKIPPNILSYGDLPESNLFVKFMDFVRKDMNSNHLVNKLISWFNENKSANKECGFGFRFRGRESFNYLQGFPSLILMLK